MRVAQTRLFAKTVKKLHANQKADLDAAVRTLLSDPLVGAEKVADLRGVRVLKVRMAGQPVLLAYAVADDTLTLLALGAHENFYRDLIPPGR